MVRRHHHHAIVLALALIGPVGPARAEDQIDALLRSGRVPTAQMHERGYSDFTEPLGRFMDLLAAGAFAEARALLPAACVQWLATRGSSAFSGKFWAFDTELDLDTLCPPR